MLRIIKVGNDDASNRYVRNKMKAVVAAGMECELIALENATTESLERLLFETSLDPKVTAVIVQLPLPKHIDRKRVFTAIAPSQDIDGLNPKSDYKPLTPCAIMRWLEDKVVSIGLLRVVILGRSELVGKPLANMLIDAGATVSVCNSRTSLRYEEYLCRNADVIVSAVGRPNTVTSFMISDNPNLIVVDVGINRDKNGKLCGDVSQSAKDKFRYITDKYGMCGCITPVPGGVGKWTVEELVMRLRRMEGKG